MADNAATDLAGHLRLVVARLHRQLRQQDRSGLAPALATALATISREGPITLGHLATREQVTPPTITRLVDQLVEQGLVSRQTDDADRRVCRVRITAAGRRRLEAIRTRRTAWLAEKLSDLTPQQVEALHDAVDVLEMLATPPSKVRDAPNDAANSEDAPKGRAS